mmetsp:Transcript_8879/g.25847  ORF Transcript_8879/g.25847 Transcript_8879/m.25847 type:complete len:243 (+) Transcript_8879:699-1427(+)
MHFSCCFKRSAAISSGFSPPSMRSATTLNASAAMESKHVLIKDTFCVEPAALNSNRAPPYGNGEVLLRSSDGTVISGTLSAPKDNAFFSGEYSDILPFLMSSKYSVKDGPKYVDITAGGASMAPKRKSLPGEAIDKRIKSPCLSMAETKAAMTTGNISALPDALFNCFGLSKLTPSDVPIDQLLCLPEPLIPANGFSFNKAAMPFSEATSSMICMTIKFWSTWLITLPNIGANSYWFGATSL